LTTEKLILNFTISKSLLNEIGNYWHEVKLPTRAEAVRELLRLGLQKHNEMKGVKIDRN